MRVRRASAGLVAVAMAFVVLGCAAKKKTDFGASQTSRSDQGGGSLDRFKEGSELGSGGPLADINYDYDQYALRQDARSTLQQNANWLKENSDKRVEVEGHCDERGTVEYNLALGAKRAKAARDYLVTLGISADRISTISYGEELPLCRETTESCYERNRRAHFVVLQ